MSYTSLMNPGNGPDVGAAHAAVMLNHIGTIAIILNSISIMAGIGLVLSSLFMLKRYGEMRTMMSHQMTLMQPMAMMAGGILLLMLPTTLSTSLLAFWGTGNTSPLAYSGSTTHDLDVYIPVIDAFVRLIGVGAIIRAAFLLSRTGGQGGQPGTMSKGMLHLFGGILCLHIVGTARLVKYIFDIHS